MKRACFQILSKTPEGDIKSLITKLQSIEAYPDKEIAIKPVLVCETCGTKVTRPRIVGVGVSTARGMGTSHTYVGIKRRMKKLKLQKEQRKVKMVREKARKRRKRRRKQKEPLNW